MKLIRVFIIAAVIALTLCELGLRFAVATASTPDSPNAIAYRLTRPPQYANSPYWSPEFVQAAHLVDRELNEDGQYTEVNQSLPGYTELDDERLTTDQPAHYAHTVWMFGSSTVWGAYVADGWTISSYLQRELNAHSIDWRVVNLGKSGATIPIETYWFKRSAVKPGDVVIYLDGGLDYRTTLQSAIKRWTDSLLPCQLSQRVALITLSLWCSSATSGDIPQAFIEQQTSIDFPHFWSDMAKAQAYARQKGIAFFHFFQPTGEPYPALYAQLRRGQAALTIDSHDYFDTLHYDDNGHAMLARQLYAAIWQSF